MERLMLVVIVGFILDLLLGDPYSLPHPVRGIGYLITKGEDVIRPRFAQNTKGEFIAGMTLTLSVIVIVTGSVLGIIHVVGKIHPIARIAVEIIITYQVLATKSLKDESMKVYKSLYTKDIKQSRQAVGMIVGRDTKHLDEQGIIKATVETIAENTTDGVIAPLFYLILGGIPLAMAYKVINTLDSMIGYSNDKYRDFGTFAAKLDDVANYIPARLSAYIMILASYISGFNGVNAYKIYKRDRYNHKSPNSAHTEAVCAGALQIQLAGDAYYFGKKIEKPTIGDAMREVTLEDIKRANRLMYLTAILSLIILGAIRLVIV